jgi:hypothetical protein
MARRFAAAYQNRVHSKRLAYPLPTENYPLELLELDLAFVRALLRVHGSDTRLHRWLDDLRAILHRKYREAQDMGCDD